MCTGGYKHIYYPFYFIKNKRQSFDAHATVCKKNWNWHFTQIVSFKKISFWPLSLIFYSTWFIFLWSINNFRNRWNQFGVLLILINSFIFTISNKCTIFVMRSSTGKRMRHPVWHHCNWKKIYPFRSQDRRV